MKDSNLKEAARAEAMIEGRARAWAEVRVRLQEIADYTGLVLTAIAWADADQVKADGYSTPVKYEWTDKDGRRRTATDSASIRFRVRDSHGFVIEDALALSGAAVFEPATEDAHEVPAPTGHSTPVQTGKDPQL
ncbi:MAG: hypothetical protein WC809_07260 [Sinimarinibacterium sp.]